MKRILTAITALILALVLSLPSAPAALAQQSVNPIAFAKSNLTEVYGYTTAEAEAFRFDVEDAGDAWKVRFSPEDHPHWQYSLEVGKADGFMRNSATPFEPNYSDYPGQNSVQDVLRAARENGWFKNWDANAIAAFQKKLSDDGHIRVNGDLQKGLATGEITAAQAIDGFFRSCYGNPTLWNANVLEWRNEVLAEYGLVMVTTNEPPLTEGVRTYQMDSRVGRAGSLLATLKVTEFIGEAPAELQEALAHPKLAGWITICGAYFVAENTAEDAPYMVADSGFVALEKGTDRMLIMLNRYRGQEAWEVIPVGEKALLKNRDMRIFFDGELRLFNIEYPVTENESEYFRVGIAGSALEGEPLCRLRDYRRIRKDTGEGITIDSERSDHSDGWYHVTTYAKCQEPTEEDIDVLMPVYLDFIDAEAFPKSMEECRAASGYELPEDYGVSSGVHLRKKTSSRSTDLGEYYSGTLVNVMELVPGNPYLWAHVRVGQTEGYMSGVYVDYAGTECGMEPLQQHTPLPVAMAKRELALKKGTGWFDGTVTKLPAGAKMHVMAVCGDWLHVMVPQNEPGWLMDVNGTDGYVKAADVLQAATALQLEWME